MTSALRRQDVDGVLALFHDDAVLFGSEDGEMAVGALELREFLARIFGRPGTYGWSGWAPVLTGGTRDLVWFVARGPKDCWLRRFTTFSSSALGRCGQDLIAAETTHSFVRRRFWRETTGCEPATDVPC